MAKKKGKKQGGRTSGEPPAPSLSSSSATSLSSSPSLSAGDLPLPSPAGTAPLDPALSLGLRQLATAFLVVAVLALVPYASSSLARLQPWQPGEGIPIVRLFQHAAETASSPVPSEPGLPPDEGGELPQVAVDPALLAAAEEDEVAEEEAPSEAPAPAPPPSGEPAPAAPAVAATEYAGVPLEIEDSHHAMDAFYASLHRTAAGEAHITRIAHFGDSTIAFDGITQTVRERMQRRFGDAGHGFVLAARGTLPYGHHQIRHESEGDWRVLDITRQSLSDGRYGLGGAQARSGGGATAFVETGTHAAVGRVASRFQVLFERYAHGGRFDYRLDGGDWTTVDTRTEDGSSSDDAVTVETEPGEHRFSIRVNGHGDVHVYGFVMENGDRGVVYDSLGYVGARASRMLGFDPTHLATQLRSRDTSLVIIGFGGNDADDDRTQDEFEYTFRRVARLVREARPEASCMLMAPLDQAQRDERGQITTLPSVPRIVEAMRSVARAEGCAFFDTWTAMGGEGAMGEWYRQEPRLSSGDFRHATPAGYRVIGEMLYRALLQGFARYERRQ
jgi:lysophospholipase L1-like esterase